MYRYFIEKKREKNVRRPRRTFWQEEDSPQQHQRKMKVKAWWFVRLSPDKQEQFKKLDDFRPETCERCWQLAWEQYVQEHFSPKPGPGAQPPVTREEQEAYRRARIANMWWLPDWHRHLARARASRARSASASRGRSEVGMAGEIGKVFRAEDILFVPHSAGKAAILHPPLGQSGMIFR